MTMATRFYAKCKNGKYRLRLDTDNKSHYQYVRGAARRCEVGKPIEQGDLIRAMNNEELADFLAEFETFQWAVRMVDGGYQPTKNQRRVAKQGFYENWLRYLKRRVEDV